MTVGGGAERSSPEGLVCEPCAGVVSVERVRAMLREAARAVPTPTRFGGAMPARAGNFGDRQYTVSPARRATLRRAADREYAANQNRRPRRG
jgi:hypothetical protein